MARRTLPTSALRAQPSGPVLDYCTEFSGITAERHATAQLTFAEAQQRFRGLIRADDILVGHSLEGDLRALRFSHKRIVDTAVLFPHPWGRPYKYALRTLAKDHLGRFIQQSVNGVGHDSYEDARACLDLLRKRVENGAPPGALRKHTRRPS